MSEIQRVGIVGDGQLGRMMAEANNAAELGLDITVLGTGSPDGPKSPAAQIKGVRQLYGQSLYDEQAIFELAEIVGKGGVLTWEVEHIGAEMLIDLQEMGYNVQASPESLAVIQDKLAQKIYLENRGISVAPFRILDTATDLGWARTQFGSRIIVKARTGGYDGRGNYVAAPDDDWTRIALKFANDKGERPDLYVEQMVPFQRELSVVGVRDTAGRLATYAVVETVHENNICHTTFAPADIDPKIHEAAEELGRATIEAFDGAGVFAVEMFHTEDDTVVVNEVAPRVHNSGHWTIEGAETSQFDNHLRAITGMPIGSTAMVAPAAAMINILGTKTMDVAPSFDSVKAEPYVYVHSYGKTPRAARKIGHITVLGHNIESAASVAAAYRARIKV